MNVSGVNFISHEQINDFPNATRKIYVTHSLNNKLLTKYTDKDKKMFNVMISKVK